GLASGCPRRESRALHQATGGSRGAGRPPRRGREGLRAPGRPRDSGDRQAQGGRRRSGGPPLARDRPRDRGSARVPGPDQGDGDPGEPGRRRRQECDRRLRDSGRERGAGGEAGSRAAREVTPAEFRRSPALEFRFVRRYHVTTIGCQMNAHDSERIKGMLEELGLGEAAKQDEADVIVFNTCTVREKPDQRFAAHLAQARALKARDPDKVIAVGGCYAEAQRERLFELYPDVDVAFGPGSIPHLGEWLGAGGEGVARGQFGIAEERAFAGRLPMRRERRFQAWVQISMGCNSVCSYCIVPSVRGREVSRRPGEILAEVESLARE